MLEMTEAKILQAVKNGRTISVRKINGDCFLGDTWSDANQVRTSLVANLLKAGKISVIENGDVRAVIGAAQQTPVTHIHDFKIDRTRKHGRKDRAFTVCACGERGQASKLTGKRFTTARPKKDPQDVKLSAGLKVSPRVKKMIRKAGYRSEQHFFDEMVRERMGL